MVSNATFNNISVILWRSVLFMEETRENHQSAASRRQTLSRNVVSTSTPHLSGIRTHNVSADRHWFQLPYDHDDGSFISGDRMEHCKNFEILVVLVCLRIILHFILK